MRGALQNVAHQALRQALHLAGAGARAIGGVAEVGLNRVGLGRDDAPEKVWGPAAVDKDEIEKDEIDKDAAEAVARQEARAAAPAAEEVPRDAGPAEEDDELRTPSGIPAAGAGYNPHTGRTGLVQPDTADPTDEGTLHAIESEAETLRRAAQEDKS